MKTNRTSSLLALAVLITIAAVPCDAIAAPIGVSPSPITVGIGVGIVPNVVTEITGIAQRVDDPIVEDAIETKIITAICIEKINVNIAVISVIQADGIEGFNLIERGTTIGV